MKNVRHRFIESQSSPLSWLETATSVCLTSPNRSSNSPSVQPQRLIFRQLWSVHLFVLNLLHSIYPKFRLVLLADRFKIQSSCRPLEYTGTPPSPLRVQATGRLRVVDPQDNIRIDSSSSPWLRDSNQGRPTKGDQNIINITTVSQNHCIHQSSDRYREWAWRTRVFCCKVRPAHYRKRYIT